MTSDVLVKTQEFHNARLAWFQAQKLYATFEFKCYLEEQMQQLEQRRAYVEIKFGVSNAA